MSAERTTPGGARLQALIDAKDIAFLHESDRCAAHPSFVVTHIRLSSYHWLFDSAAKAGSNRTLLAVD